MSLILVCAAASIAALSVAWLIVRRTGDGGWTDVVWALSVGMIGAGAALWPASDASSARQGLVALLIGVWALRLGGYLAGRTARASSPDPRYEDFRKQWGGWGLKAWGFLMIQAATVLVLVVSIRAAATRPEPGLDWRDGLAALIVLVAVVGEAVAAAAPGRRRRRRSRCGPPDGRLPPECVWSRQGRRHRFVGMVAAPELLFRMDGLAGLAGHGV